RAPSWLRIPQPCGRDSCRCEPGGGCPPPPGTSGRTGGNRPSSDLTALQSHVDLRRALGPFSVDGPHHRLCGTHDHAELLDIGCGNGDLSVHLSGNFDPGHAPSKFGRRSPFAWVQPCRKGQGAVLPGALSTIVAAPAFEPSESCRVRVRVTIEQLEERTSDLHRAVELQR